MWRGVRKVEHGVESLAGHAGDLKRKGAESAKEHCLCALRFFALQLYRFACLESLKLTARVRRLLRTPVCGFACSALESRFPIAYISP